LLVLPLREDECGNGIYPEGTLALVKRLRAEGVDAGYLHPPERRLFEGRKGVILDAVASLALGVMSSAAWDGLKRMFRGRSEGKLKVTFGQVSEADAGPAQWWQVEGDSADVLAAIDKLMSGSGTPRPADDGPPEVSEPPRGPAGSSTGGLAAPQRQAEWAAIPDGSDRDLREEAVAKRRDDYLGEARSLRDQASSLLASDYEAAERCARRALDRVVRAFWWTEDQPEEETVHEVMHGLGRWVRETFDCTIHFSNGVYEQRCPVAIAHKRMGMSVGFTARRMCSLCGEDISECLHLPGIAYLVPGGIGPGGCCPVCLSEACADHDPAQTYRVSAVSKIVDMDVHEISLVGRPRQPEARLLSIPLPTDDLRETLGPEFVVGMPLSCDKCLSGCSGFTTLEQPAGD